MTKPYLLRNIQGITVNSGSKKSRHTVHCVHYTLHENDDVKIIPIFYKEKKGQDPRTAINEVAFSELARLFMLTNSTPEYHLVVNNENKVVGNVSHSIQYIIDQHTHFTSKDSPPPQYKNIRFSEEGQYVFDDVTVTNTDEIPYKFLDKLPQGIFAHLMAERNKGTLSIDMDSLASTLAGKYILEEDDLHRGNIGIYITEKDNKPHVTFFNIDHDLMMSDSITSHLNARIANWILDDTAFNITPYDLLHFPDLRDSCNHYWPTRKRLMVKYGDNKIYALAEERAAFRDLQYDLEFNRYKWKRFLKGILIPDELIQKSLELHLDPNNPQDAANINLISQSMNERVIKLRAALFSIPEFRDYLNSLQGKEDIQAIRNELTPYIEEILPAQNKLIAGIQEKISERINQYIHFCNPSNQNTIVPQDNPLHTTIRLGNYHFDQSQKAFSQYINTPNKNGELPLDVAATLANSYIIGSEKTDPAKDPFTIMKHLLSEGAKMTPKALAVLKAKKIDINTYFFQSHYYGKEVKNYADLRTLITEIGKDNHFSLKTKKMITVNLVKQHIENLSPKERTLLKEDLNGTRDKPIAPEFLFISQLRSSLWIIRVIRGLYGHSSTRMELNALLQSTGKNQELKSKTPFFLFKPPQKSTATSTAMHHDYFLNNRSFAVPS